LNVEYLITIEYPIRITNIMKILETPEELLSFLNLEILNYKKGFTNYYMQT